MHTCPPERHAVVIGGSVAGLAAAQVLSNHFDQVTILEKDALPVDNANRKGVPQGRHVHALLIRGQMELEALFPGLTRWMVAQGALSPNMGRDAAWYLFGGFRPRYHSDLTPLCSSRPLLERGIRNFALQNPKIQLCQGAELIGLMTDASRSRVEGVRHREIGANQQRQIHAALVVDASGRGSRTPRLLQELGLPTPEEITVTSKAAYATRVYELAAGPSRDWQVCYVQPTPGGGTRGGIIAPIEGGRHIVTLIGMAGDHPPTTEDGFLEFARSLPAPQIAQALESGKALSPIYGFANAENRLRRYDALTRRLDGLLALGDAVYALNPVYGQGMTVASLAARTLGEVLERRKSATGPRLEGISAEFQRKLAGVIALPWQMATGEDLRWPIPENAGRIGLVSRIMNAWVDRVQRATLHSGEITEAFYRVAQMLDAPTALMHPSFILKVLRARTASRALPAPAQGSEVRAGGATAAAAMSPTA